MNQTAKPAPLGRGLSALFGDSDKSYQATNVPAPSPSEKRGVTSLAIGWIQPGPFQPRRNFDDEALKELAESVRARGILQPLLVRPVKGLQNRYEIIAGERRWRAAQMASLHEIPVVIRELADSEALEFGLIENVQRQDLSPLEEAEGYKRLMEEFLHTQEVLAKIVGKSRSHISNLVRLVDLPLGVKQMIDNGELSAGHARVLVTAKDPLTLAIRIVREGLNVRQAEGLAKSEAENPQIHKKKLPPDANTVALEKDLARATGLKISITPRGRKGSITLYYQNLDQLDAVIAKLKS
jgi:ParB family chromosome partitioning protein